MMASPVNQELEIEDAVARADMLLASGHGRDAVDLLVDTHRRTGAAGLEERLVQVRHRAFPSTQTTPAPSVSASVPWPAPLPDPFTEPGVPEVSACDLTSDLLSAALQHRGSLIVRGFLGRSVAGRLLATIRETLRVTSALSDDIATGAPLHARPPWYVPFEPEARYSFGAIERRVADWAGGVLSVEAPHALNEVIEALRAAGVGELLNDYFGEWPALSAKKSTLRHATPTSLTEWHQDGAFLGEGIKTLNTWIALTSCGIDAPGIDIFARPFDAIVETGTDDALFHWSVSPEQVERIGTSSIVRPVFEPGDALLFNQMALHRTGVDRTMTKDRIAIESWFFAPSTYPDEQVPLVF